MHHDVTIPPARQTPPKPLVPTDWGVAVRAYREAHDWSIGDLAQQAHLRPSTIHKWEIGTARPTPYSHVVKTLLAYANVATVADFMEAWRPAAPEPRRDPWRLAVGQAVRTALLLALDALNTDDWPRAETYIRRALLAAGIAEDEEDSDGL